MQGRWAYQNGSVSGCAAADEFPHGLDVYKRQPHGIAVVVERFKERPDKDLIDLSLIHI